MTVHLVYPHRETTSAPHSIGRNLASILRSRFDLVQHDLDSFYSIAPRRGDVLIGHPHPIPGTIFRRSLRNSGWHRTLIMCPFTTSVSDYSYLDPIVRNADRFLAITGRYWIEKLEDSPFAHWRNKMLQLDLAVDMEDFPPIKKVFHRPGARRFVYIGNCQPQKNTDYLATLSQRLAEPIGWIGGGGRLRGVVPLGYHDFSSSAARSLIADYDFMVTVGSHDANPTTVLEAMAWGLIPVTSPQSGYINYDSIPTIPLNDADRAIDILNSLQHKPEQQLRAMQDTNWRLIHSHFNWQRFGSEVLRAIEEDPPRPPTENADRSDRLRLLAGRIAGRNSPFRPRVLRQTARAHTGRYLRRRAGANQTNRPL